MSGDIRRLSTEWTNVGRLLGYTSGIRCVLFLAHVLTREWRNGSDVRTRSNSLLSVRDVTPRGTRFMNRWNHLLIERARHRDRFDTLPILSRVDHTLGVSLRGNSQIILVISRVTGSCHRFSTSNWFHEIIVLTQYHLSVVILLRLLRLVVHLLHIFCYDIIFWRLCLLQNGWAARFMCIMSHVIGGRLGLSARLLTTRVHFFIAVEWIFDVVILLNRHVVQRDLWLILLALLLMQWQILSLLFNNFLRSRIRIHRVLMVVVHLTIILWFHI